MNQDHIRRACAAFAFGLLAIGGTDAIAREGAWTQGFGQGNLEYFIDAKGWRLYIGCPTQDGSADATSSVSLIALANDKSANKFSIRVGGNVYEGPFEADSRVGANNFTSLLEDLRKSDATVQYGRTQITFPKSNVAKVVPVYGKGLKCNVG
jgi:hypothetical protein